MTKIFSTILFLTLIMMSLISYKRVKDTNQIELNIFFDGGTKKETIFGKNETYFEKIKQ